MSQSNKSYQKDTITISQLFEEQVIKTPNKIAVIFGNLQLTYLQLNERANQIAHYLRKKEVQPDALVAIACDRSLEMIAGILGILKAGGAYIPIDPSYPEERIAYIFEDSKAMHLLTQPHLIKIFSQIKYEFFLLDVSQNNTLSYPVANLASITLPHHLAYVIYTSGSTGQPKGVMISNRALVNHMLWMKENYDLSEDACLLQRTSFSFDASVWEIFLPLISGSKLALSTGESSKDIQELIKLLQEYEITSLQLVPSLAQVFIQSLGNRICFPSLKHLFLGGEALSSSLAEQLSSQLKVELTNLYGPTEATIEAITFRCKKIPSFDNLNTLPIGKPISNTHVYILDSFMQAVPVGISGEIYIGGVGLARGYLNRQDLTAEKFIPNPFVGEEDFKEGKNLRLYKTGDLGRYLPDGNIEFLGRRDDQVKIRGFRIELGEIETTLTQHGDVNQAVVLAREDEPGHKQLVAYVVAQERILSSLESEVALFSSANEGFSVLKGESIPALTEDLRNHLGRTLPDYMVPSFFVYLDRIPLTPNGKADNKNLPIPTRQRNAKNSVAPRTDLEKIICKIWEDILKIEKIGITDNFFELGGDSILNIQVVSSARKLGLFLKPRDIFQYPTVAEICPMIKQATFSTKKRKNKGIVPLLPIQHWFFESQFTDANHWNQSFLLKLKERLNWACFETALRHVFSHHQGFHISYKRKGTSTKQYYKDFRDILPISCIDLKFSANFARDLKKYVALTQKKINFEKGPLYQVVLLDGGLERGKFLFIAIHHLIIDGVSWRILWEDIETAYHQIIDGKPLSLLEEINTYKDWGVALKNYAYSSEAKHELPYWLSINSRLSLPKDYDKGINTWRKSKNIKIVLNHQLTHKLLYDVPRAYRTQINDVLLTALVLAFHDWTGKLDLFLCLEGHGREDFMRETLDLSRAVGWFTTLYPIILSLHKSKQATLGDHLKSIKEQIRAIPSRGIGYGALRYMSRNKKLKEILRRLDTTEISFNYLGQLDSGVTRNSLFDLYSFNSSLDDISPKNMRSYLIDINGFISEGQLTVDFAYSIQLHRQETIEQLANNYLKYLINIISHCEKPDIIRNTPSDFPLALLSQEEINTFLPTDIQDAYPLSPMQQGILFHALQDSTKSMYQNQTILWVEGELNEEFLKKAWTTIIKNCDSLRTSFLWEGLKTPLQVVYPEVTLPWNSEDWQSVSKQEISSRLEALLFKDIQRGYDLTCVPIFRIYFFRTSPKTAILIWSHHHIFMDGWSLPNIISLLFSIYENNLKKINTEISYLRPFKEYVNWGINQNHKNAMAYWKNLLEDFKDPTFLGIENDKLQQSGESDIFIESEELRFSNDEYKKIKAFAQRGGLTLSSLLNGVWGILLSRYSGRSDVVFGAVSGRSTSLENIEKQIGLFINTLPVRVKIRESEKVKDYLKILQDQMSCSREYEYTPLWEIQQLSEVSRGMPLFNYIVVFDTYATPEFKFIIKNQQTLKITESQTLEHEHYNFSIGFAASQNLLVKVRYNAAIYKKSSIVDLLINYKFLLKLIIEHPTYNLSRLNLLTFKEKSRKLLRKG